MLINDYLFAQRLSKQCEERLQENATQASADLTPEEIHRRAAVLVLRLIALGECHPRQPDSLWSDEWQPIRVEVEKIKQQLSDQAGGADPNKEKWLDD